MVGGVVLGSQRNQAEAGLGKLQRDHEIGGHERPFSHERERTRQELALPAVAWKLKRSTLFELAWH
jgi:hypothetical protein